ncbi:HET-domain-containing protein, partial [Macroventuria anomochaeta]
MRLLETTDGRTYNLTKDFLRKDEVPAYAILSHTWDADQEVTFDDIVEDNKNRYSKLRASLRLRPRPGKKGYYKLQFCARQAKRDGLRYFWVDTCCIDKKNLAELQKAINSMFSWYRDAAKCYVFLSDVSIAGRKENSESPAWQLAFAKSRWFTRGWTLQELLAPAVVEFFSREGVYLGDRLKLKQQIHDITDIPSRALCGASLDEFGIDERLSWAVERQTTREEDEVYALLGIFGVSLPFIYDEGYDKALRRLLDEIAKTHV